MSHVPQALFKTIINFEIYSQRFERFAKEIVEQLEGGRPVVLTSPSWDLGRDGRSAVAREEIVVCASLSAKVTDKSRTDVQRLVSTTPRIESLYFISSQELSEHAADTTKGDLENLLPAETHVAVLGSNHIAGLVCERWPEMMDRFYRGEVDDLRTMLFSGEEDEPREEQALKLALSVSPSDDTEEIRDKVYDASLYKVFSDNEWRSVASASRDLSAFLKAGRSLPSDLVRLRLDRLHESGGLSKSHNLYKITETGHSIIAKTEESAAKNINIGRNELIDAIEEEIGQNIIQDHRDQIWKVLKERLAWIFYARGQEMLATMSELVGSDADGQEPTEDSSAATEPPDFADLVRELADAVARTTSNAEQADELRTAVADLFSQKVGPAFKWLVQTCAAFVSACSLGLEHTTGKAIADVLGRTTLVLDTDVMLSLLNEGEPDHESVNSMVKRWQALGGHVVTARPVLKEVAHHAWIAEQDYQNVRDLLPGDELDRVRYINNSFVRGFAELLEQNKAKSSDWPRYIREFKGKGSWDEESVEAIIVRDYKIDIAPPPSVKEEDIQCNVSKRLRDQASKIENQRTRKNVLDKSRRDAELYASLIRLIRSERKTSMDAGCYLVSSARRLQDIEDKFGETGEKRAVVSIASVLYMLSLVPGVSLSPKALNAFLFETRGTVFDSELERVVLRVIKSSGEASLPWAKRTTMMRNLRRQIVDRSGKKGDRTESGDKDILRHVDSEMGSERFAEEVKNALDSVAADTQTEKRNRELSNRVKELEKEIERLRAGK